jgi:predicted outer membrane repeat protein
LPVIAANDNLTIVGNSDTIQRKSNSPAFRIFEVASGASLALANLTVQNGSVPDDEGGGILNRGTLSVSGCTLSGNSAAIGGGIMNLGTATVQSSTLSGNSAIVNGGGIANYPGGSMTITGSTVSHNSATLGGGIFNAGSMFINSCTVSHNDAGQDGGGIYASAQGTFLDISNSLVCNNSAMLGADVFIQCGALVHPFNSTICNTYNNCLT